MSDEKEKKKLSIMRVRAVQSGNSAPFMDPEADIRKIYPNVAKAVAMELEDFNADNPEAAAAYKTIHNYLVIMEIRLGEDHMPCSQQITAFYRALDTVPRQYVDEWMRSVNVAMNIVYGLFYRRDYAYDGNPCVDYTKEAITAVRKLREEGAFKSPGREHYNQEGYAEDINTEAIYSRIQHIAKNHLQPNSDMTWDELADACDAEFNAVADNCEDLKAMALALAYPTYNHPTLAVDIEVEE